MKLPFTGGFYKLPATSLSNQRCVNLFVHNSEGMTDTKQQILGFSGIREVVNTGYGKTRGSIVFQNELYRLDGTTLVKIDTFGGVVDVSGGTSIAGVGRVFMAENGETICIVDPYSNSYFYDPTNGLAQITDADFLSITSTYGNARSVTYSDGFFVFNTDKVLFQGSLVTTNGGRSFNALEFDDADQFPDDLVTVIASQGNLYAFGTDSFEIYRFNPNTTTGEFAFIRVSTQNNEKGLVGRFNVISADSVIYFIGGSKRERPAVWTLSGASLNKISTDAVDVLIEDDTEGFALAWSERGQMFRAFTFNTTTIVYNLRTGIWQEIQEENFTKGWRVQTVNRAYGKLYVSDDTGKHGEMDKDVYTWFGDTILDYFTTMPFTNVERAFGVQWIEAECQGGVGNDDTTNPTIAMSTSRDGAITFGTERYKDLGDRGDRSKRQRWYNLGRFDDEMVLRFAFSEPCLKAFIGLEASFL